VRDSFERYLGKGIRTTLRRLFRREHDLTQLTLGVDRDSGDLATLFDEQDEAVKWMIESVIREAHKAGAKIGLCGEAPSNHPEFAQFLVACGIDSISVSPDSFASVKNHIAASEAPSTQRLSQSL
jgi:pyruvate,water dikinase